MPRSQRVGIVSRLPQVLVDEPPLQFRKRFLQWPDIRIHVVMVQRSREHGGREISRACRGKFLGFGIIEGTSCAGIRRKGSLGSPARGLPVPNSDQEVMMLELNGWGPLVVLWIGGILHLGWLVRQENREARRRDEMSRRQAA